MKKKMITAKIKSISLIAISMLCISMLSGCSFTRTVPTELWSLDATFTVTIQDWTDSEEQPEPTTTNYKYSAHEDFEGELFEGQIIFSNPVYGEISVHSIFKEDIWLEIKDSGFVEENPNGTISLIAEPITNVFVDDGKEVTIVTQTMDGGISITFKYKATEYTIEP